MNAKTNLNGAVRIDVEGDATVTASNLRIKTSSAKEHCALLLKDGVTLDLHLHGGMRH